MFRAGLWCVVALMVGGCLEATTKSVRETLPTTVGLTEQNIFERYGSPARATPTQDGGRELEYVLTKIGKRRAAEISRSYWIALVSCARINIAAASVKQFVGNCPSPGQLVQQLRHMAQLASASKSTEPLQLP